MGSSGLHDDYGCSDQSLLTSVQDVDKAFSGKCAIASPAVTVACNVPRRILDVLKRRYQHLASPVNVVLLLIPRPAIANASFRLFDSSRF